MIQGWRTERKLSRHSQWKRQRSSSLRKGKPGPCRMTKVQAGAGLEGRRNGVEEPRTQAGGAGGNRASEEVCCLESSGAHRGCYRGAITSRTDGGFTKLKSKQILKT